MNAIHEWTKMLPILEKKLKRVNILFYLTLNCFTVKGQDQYHKDHTSQTLKKKKKKVIWPLLKLSKFDLEIGKGQIIVPVERSSLI